MTENSVQDGEAGGLEAAALVRPVITTPAIRNGITAIRPAQTMMCLVVSHVQFGSSLLRRLLSQASGSRELAARVMLLKNGWLVGHPYWFGGEQKDLAVIAPREYAGGRLNRLRGRSPAMLCGTPERATRARSVRRCKRDACEYCRKIREMST